MSLPAADSLNGANFQQLTAYSGNWSLNTGDFDFLDSGLATDAGGDCLARWNADVFDNNQYVEWDVISMNTSASALGGALRVSTAGALTAYIAASDLTSLYVYKLVAGVATTLATITKPADTVRVRFEANGTALKVYYNSVIQSGASVTDSSIAAGSAGVAGYEDNQNNLIKNWAAGNLVVVAGSIIYRRASVFVDESLILV